ncbi:histone-lysine N-methyltransferase SETMAR [Trichonephila clavipes]|nr:histone-lysine N-methyltransferase SETMAR [Trichonephila clavipes]
MAGRLDIMKHLGCKLGHFSVTYAFQSDNARIKEAEMKSRSSTLDARRALRMRKKAIHEHFVETEGVTRMIRWVLKLAEFNIEWEHRLGTQNTVDVLSRNPVESTVWENVDCTVIRDLVLSSREQLIKEQRRDPELGHTYRYLENREDSSVNATILVYKIVTEDLNFKNCVLGGYPDYSQPNTKKRFAISLDFLIRYEEEGNDMLSRIVTGDEPWISHISPETKQKSMEWRHTSPPIKVKAKQTLSKHKIIETVF